MKREIIDFWRAVEMFSPQSVPAVRPSDQVFSVEAGEPLPWEEGHRLREEPLSEHQVWRHAVYVGLYPQAQVFGALKEVFPAPADSYQERPSASSALLGFGVSGDGTILEGSAVLSACAWATARALDPGPESAGWLDGFETCEGDLTVELEERYLPIVERKRQSIVLDWDALADCRSLAIAALGVEDVLSITGIRVRSEKVARRNADSFEHDFLNSFIARDLSRVALAVHRGDVGPALARYLRPEKEIDLGARVNVQAEFDAVRRATDPDRTPSGRWPAGPDRPLALGQQLAVDEAVAMPGRDDRLLAVNGPPGTGKTTMLRDLIAALVTDRAERLAELSDPAEAFLEEDPYRWKTSRYQRVVHRLKPELTGFEMVVASSNNGAVENVTLELPSAAAIDPAWADAIEQLDYFPELAQLATQAESWGLVAARLGNSQNRKGFVNAVWWPKRRKDTGQPEPPARLLQLLTEWEERPVGPSWTEAVETFEQARSRVSAIRADRLAACEALDRIVELEPEFEQARAAERVAVERVTASRPRRDQLTSAAGMREAERQRRVEAREEEHRRCPFVLRFRARAAWRERDAELAAEIASLDALLDEIGEELRRIEDEVRLHEETELAVEKLDRALAELRPILARYSDKPGAQIPDAEWLSDRQVRERRAPWTDAEWNQARTELFLAALGLHRAFLVHAAQPMRRALAGAMDVVSGSAPSDLSGDALLAAWQTLFLVVPVVSTTFASVGRIFGRLGSQDLGWLLVDEAGQATPQNAVGALWRCRQAVIVGDPQQLEPITTIPFPLEQAIREHYGVDEEWLTGRGSAQSLADRQNRLGTMLPGAERPVWVGAPLSVHRRCDEPMFGLSNEIAYGGLMVDATDPALAEAFAAEYPTLPASCWIDVASSDAQGHWVPAEGVELDRVLTGLEGIDIDFGQVMAIGPFRDVARRLKDRAKRHHGLKAGTIHTAQGKEADIVILVLGSDPASEGARAWAASRPNLLNVAVSRARRRLYVIGNREAWMGHPYFGRVAEQLPHRQAPG